MLDLIKCERLKYKRTVIKKLIFLIPIAVTFLGIVMIPYNTNQLFAYNMWYLFMLPFLVGYIVSSMVAIEKKHLYHGLLGVFEDKKKLWYAKTFYGIIIIFLANVVMSIFGIGFKFVFNSPVGVKETIIAMLVLSIVYAWQVPLFMCFSRKINFIIVSAIATVLNVGLSINFALKVWWLPFAMPTRLMCPLLKIYPNGEVVEDGSKYLDNGIVAPSIVISIILLIVVTIVTAKLFEKEECK